VRRSNEEIFTAKSKKSKKLKEEEKKEEREGKHEG
jgi:hypothetical protein